MTTATQLVDAPTASRLSRCPFGTLGPVVQTCSWELFARGLAGLY